MTKDENNKTIINRNKFAEICRYLFRYLNDSGSVPIQWFMTGAAGSGKGLDNKSHSDQ